MKRFFTYIAILALAVGCKDLYGPEETPLAPDTAGSVEVTITDVTDNSFKVTLTPSGNVSYYSYLVDASATAETLDPVTLYKVGYSSVAQGTVKYTAEAPSYTFEVKATPNTSYQVYAVAASEMGFAGNITVKGTKTTDTVAPGYESYQTNENQVLFTFSEAVTRGSGAIKVPYYAYYTAEFQQSALPAGEIEIPEDAIQVAGNQAMITVPGLPTGAYWTISIAEGAFVDAVGQKLPAYASSFVVTEDGPAPKGFYGEITYIETPMLGTLEAETFADWTKPFVIPVKATYPVAGLSKEKFVTVTYETQTSTSTQTTVHTLAPGETYGMTASGFVVYLPEQPAIGATVTIDVPAGCLYDIYGNDCEAWSCSLLHSYGYTLADITGTYTLAEQSAFDGQVYTTSLEIKESDDAAKGNVMFTVYDDITCNVAPIYATFDTEAGTLTVPAQQVFAAVSLGGTPYYTCFTSCTVSSSGSVGIGKDPVIFEVKQPNVITGPNYYYGVLLLDASGTPTSWYDVYGATQAVLATGTTSTQAAATPRFNNWVSLDNAIISRF